jgi:hypothetical protein
MGIIFSKLRTFPHQRGASLLFLATAIASSVCEAGMREISSDHLVLHTDVEPAVEVDRLPVVFDEAVPQWCVFFGVDPQQARTWRVQACLIRDRERFQAAGLLPESLPAFAHGFSRGDRIWLYEQPTQYYRRHLLLHEGTHAFMERFLGGCGPPWFMEGTAELLATHRIRDGSLELAYFPQGRKEVPMLGRIKLVQQAVAERRAMSLDAILAYGSRAHSVNEPYAWCWAVLAFLYEHPHYHTNLPKLFGHVPDAEFNRRMKEVYAADWAQLSEEWELFAATLQYGHDVRRTAIDFRRGEPLVAPMRLTISADRGWQNSGIWLEAERKYRVEAFGRYQVADRPAIWWCEPGGVTIRYWRGQPLGILLAAVRPAGRGPQSAAPFLNPLVLGNRAELRPATSGTLYLSINDSPGELQDNAGMLDVLIRPDGDNN